MKQRSNLKRQQNENQLKYSAADELSSFSLAAALSDARTTSTQPRKIFPGNFRTSNASQQSIATNASFVTAQESIPQAPTNDSVTTPAVSYFVDSSDDETDQGSSFGDDPLSVLSRTAYGTPKEISFSCTPEETMPSENIASNVSSGPEPVPTPKAPEPTPVIAEQTEKEGVVMEPATAATEDGAHFDVAQTVYGTAKNVWAWGKTVPVITNVLGITEAIAAKVLDAAVHMDLPAIDQEAVMPQLKKLDDDIVTPVILAVWQFIGPTVSKGEELVVKPVLNEVVPRVLAPLAVFDRKKKEEELRQKKEEEKISMIDASATPEIVPALS